MINMIDNTIVARFLVDPEELDIVLPEDKDKKQKQNMTLDGFTTTKDLDLQVEAILKSIEPEVMDAIKKVTK